jgi:hypothetical protein
VRISNHSKQLVSQRSISELLEAFKCFKTIEFISLTVLHCCYLLKHTDESDLTSYKISVARVNAKPAYFHEATLHQIQNDVTSQAGRHDILKQCTCECLNMSVQGLKLYLNKCTGISVVTKSVQLRSGSRASIPCRCRDVSFRHSVETGSDASLH